MEIIKDEILSYIKSKKDENRRNTFFYDKFPFMKMYGITAKIIIGINIDSLGGFSFFYEIFKCQPLYISKSFYVSSSNLDIEFSIKFKEMISNIQSIKYTKTAGFHTESSSDMINYKFLENDNIKLLIENCCVCLEETITTTKCGHYYCFQCQDKNKKKTCPICRKNLRCNDSDSDYESETEE